MGRAPGAGDANAPRRRCAPRSDHDDPAAADRDHRREPGELCRSQPALPAQHLARQRPGALFRRAALRVHPRRPPDRPDDLCEILRREDGAPSGVGLGTGDRVASAPAGPPLGAIGANAAISDLPEPFTTGPGWRTPRAWSIVAPPLAEVERFAAKKTR